MTSKRDTTMELTKKPYTISTASDGITSITMAGLTELFKTRQTALSFALALADRVSDRRTGIFHLQDTPDGKLQMIMHKTGNVITFKDYDQAAKLADMLVKELLP